MNNTQKTEHVVFLNISSHWADKILNGEKTIELRKRFVENLPSSTKMFLCTSSNYIDYVVASVKIDRIEKLEIEKLKTLKDKHCADDDFFHEYFEIYGCKKGYAIHISNPVKFKTKLPLSKFGSLGLLLPEYSLERYSFLCVPKQEIVNDINTEQNYLDKINEIL